MNASHSSVLTVYRSGLTIDFYQWLEILCKHVSCPKKQTLQISDYLSKKLSRLSFFGMLTVVYVHSFNFDDRYLWPGRPFSEDMNVWNFIQVLITNGLFRFGVPLFFFRAGLLMAETESRYSPLSRVKKRVQTLLLPYVAWSLIGIGITWYFESNPAIAPFAESSWLRPFGNLEVHKWSVIQWFEAVLITPVSFQLWFLRSLFMYSILYPFLVKALAWKPYWFLVAFAFFWFTSFGLPLFVEGEGLLFFTLGIFYAKGGIDVEKLKGIVFRYKILWVLPFLLLGKTGLAFESDNWIGLGYILHKFCQPLLVLAVWFGYDWLAGGIQKTPFEHLSRYNFFIYGLHVPLVYYLTDWIFKVEGNASSFRFVVFTFLPLAVAGVALTLGFILDKGLRPVFWVLTGGRK